MKTFKQFLKEALPISHKVPKSLRKAQKDDYYYHMTKGRNMKGISKKGLSTKPKRHNYSGSKKNTVYLASTKSDAEQYAMDLGYGSKKHHSLRTIKIHKSKVDSKHMHRDANMSYMPHEVPTTWEYDKKIKAKDIEFKGGDSYKKDTRKWKKKTDTWY